MLKKVNNFLNIIIGAFIGVFIGHGVYVFWDYKTHPEIDASYSAPWYTSILVYGIFTVVVVLIAFVIKWFIRKRIPHEA